MKLYIIFFLSSIFSSCAFDKKFPFGDDKLTDQLNKISDQIIERPPQSGYDWLYIFIAVTVLVGGYYLKIKLFPAYPTIPILPTNVAKNNCPTVQPHVSKEPGTISTCSDSSPKITKETDKIASQDIPRIKQNQEPAQIGEIVAAFVTTFSQPIFNKEKNE